MIIMKILKFITIAIWLVLFISACVPAQQPLTERNSQLTQGNIEMNLAVGKTTKADVLEKFGAPNITTRDGSGREVWSYQRSAQVTQSSVQAGYWTIILAGQAGGTSGYGTSSRMITLIIKFNDKGIVSDFNSRTADF
jgi:outer membrane protein assembly factor BamE (lipoprotein component of BamABCDE complex)